MEPKRTSQKCQGSTGSAKPSESKPAKAKSARNMTAAMIDQLIKEFRQLQLEVTEMKTAGKQV